MLSNYLAILVAASLASAATPTGFQPGSNTELIVEFGSLAAQNGAVVAKASTQTMPTIATTQRLNGTAYAVIMVDLDIPTNTPPATNTLLHWMQTGLAPATAATKLNTTQGSMNVFVLQNTSNTAPLASYLGPAPPAMVPLSHRYTQILVDHSGLSDAGVEALKTAAASRQGFSAMKVLMSAGLTNKVVAGNFFNVTNAGPAANAVSGTNGTATGAGSARPSGTGGASGTRPSSTSTPFTGAAAAIENWSVPALLAVGVLFLGL